MTIRTRPAIESIHLNHNNEIHYNDNYKSLQ